MQQQNVKFVNLTPHKINVHVSENSVIEIEPSGTVCRVTTKSVPAGWAGGIPAFRTELGEVVNLPEEDGDSIFIVSGMVAAAAPREDVFSPGELVRDSSGRPVGCLGLRRSI